MTPNQQAQLRQSQQAQQANQPRQAAKPPMQTELEQIVVYQAAKMRDLEQQVIQANTAAMQLQAVLQNSEQVSAQHQERVSALEKDLEACRALHGYLSVEHMVKKAHADAMRPKAEAPLIDASPAPAPQTPAEVPA